MHVFREQGMVVSIVGIILRGVVFTDDRVDRQIQKQAQIRRVKVPTQQGWQFIGFNDLLQDNECPNLEGIASTNCTLLDRKFNFGKILQKILVGYHSLRIVRILFADGDAFRDGILSLRVIDPFIVNFACKLH